MSTLLRNADVRTIAAGLTCSRAAAQTPQTTTANIFTVTGGRILVRQLIGYTTVAFDATATTLKALYLGSAAGASAADLSIASAALANAAIGTSFWLPSAVASALAADSATLSGGLMPWLAHVCPAGAVRIQGAGSNVAARVKWDLIYVPLDSGVTVTAA